MEENMMKAEFLAFMLALLALLETGNTEKAKEVLKDAIKDAKRKD